MKKRLQVLMLAALPILGVLALYEIREYQLPENVFRRNTQGVTMIEIDNQVSISPGKTRLNASDSAQFVKELRLERHSKSDMFRGLSNPQDLQFFQGNRLIARLDYVPGYGLKSRNAWWRDCYLLTPSSKHELNAILKKYNCQFP